jgi:hypothetical protein
VDASTDKGKQMALTFATILPSAGANTLCQTFSVPSGYVPAEFANGLLTIVSSTGASAETVYAVNASAAINPAISAQTIPAAATTVLFAEGGWCLVK